MAASIRRDWPSAGTCCSSPAITATASGGILVPAACSASTSEPAPSPARLDLPPRCRHAGGIAIAEDGTVYLADTFTLFVFRTGRRVRACAVAEGDPACGRSDRSSRLRPRQHPYRRQLQRRWAGPDRHLRRASSGSPRRVQPTPPCGTRHGRSRSPAPHRVPQSTLPGAASGSPEVASAGPRSTSSILSAARYRIASRRRPVSRELRLARRVCCGQSQKRAAGIISSTRSFGSSIRSTRSCSRSNPPASANTRDIKRPTTR